MKRRIQWVVGAFAITITLAAPAQAGQARTVIWRCDVPEVGTVDFVTAAEAARHGIDTADSHAGQVFQLQFGEECVVI